MAPVHPRYRTRIIRSRSDTLRVFCKQLPRHERALIQPVEPNFRPSGCPFQTRHVTCPLSDALAPHPPFRSRRRLHCHPPEAARYVLLGESSRIISYFFFFFSKCHLHAARSRSDTLWSFAERSHVTTTLARVDDSFFASAPPALVTRSLGIDFIFARSATSGLVFLARDTRAARARSGRRSDAHARFCGRPAREMQGADKELSRQTCPMLGFVTFGGGCYKRNDLARVVVLAKTTS